MKMSATRGSYWFASELLVGSIIEFPGHNSKYEVMPKDDKSLIYPDNVNSLGRVKLKHLAYGTGAECRGHGKYAVSPKVYWEWGTEEDRRTNEMFGWVVSMPPEDVVPRPTPFLEPLREWDE